MDFTQKNMFNLKETPMKTLEEILLIPSENIPLDKRLLLPIHFRQISVIPSTNQIITEDIHILPKGKKHKTRKYNKK